MNLRKDFLEGLRIGRQIAHERSQGRLSMASSRSAQLRIEDGIIGRLHPDPLTFAGKCGVAIGGNLASVVFSILGGGIFVWWLFWGRG